MEELKIIIEGLTRQEKDDLSHAISDYCQIEESKGADSIVMDVFTIIGDQAFLYSVAANLFTEMIKNIPSDTWDKLKIFVKMPNGKKFANIGKNTFIKIYNKFFKKDSNG